MKEKIDKAIECFKKQDWNGAIDLFTSIVEIDTENAEVYNNLGLCYVNIGDEDKAEKNYLKSKVFMCLVSIILLRKESRS